MTKKAPILMMLLAAVGVASHAAAQSPVAQATRQAELQALSDRLHQRDRLDRQQVESHAARVGIEVRRELAGGRVLELQRLVPGQGPVFYLTCNIDAADTVSTDEVWPGGSLGLNLDGSGMNVAEWDGGAIYADHPDLAGRVNQVDGASVVSGHSTHVAGTLIGAGDWLAPDAIGMAHAAQLDAYDWNSDTAEMAAAAASGQIISNHSYGIAAGWLYIGDLPPDTWWWIGGEDPEDVEDPNFGYYDAESQLWDQIVYDAPYYLPVKAAGNDRSDIGPAPGEEYWVIDQDGNFLFISTLPRQPDCAPAGYDCLPTHSVAKNILTVGAVDDVPGGYSELAGPAAVNMADFSSWGPTDDGRIKPDLVGNGVLLFSTWPDNPYYALAAGTSMSAPNVTGSLLLLQQHYEDLHGPGNFMRGATLKALAIHAADEAGDWPGPDYSFGWGLLNTKSAARIITEDGGDHQIIEGTLANGASVDHVINVTEADRVVTATLVWSDPPGTPVAPALDPPDLMLVNDLDLRILRGPATYYPWVLDPANPDAAATTGDNFRDNVEQVEVSGAGSGNFTIRVSHKGTLLGGAPQDYSLIISVNPPPPTGSNFLIDEDFSDGLPPGWSVDTPQGVPWTINDPVPGDSRLDNHTGGSGRFAMVDNLWSRTLTSFRSYFQFDELESINVDISTNGGADWTNVWQWQGFNPFPTRYVLDLSDSIAGRSDVKVRFRYNTYGDPQGNLWQIDDIELEGRATSGRSMTSNSRCSAAPNRPGRRPTPSPATAPPGSASTPTSPGRRTCWPIRTTCISAPPPRSTPATSRATRPAPVSTPGRWRTRRPTSGHQFRPRAAGERDDLLLAHRRGQCRRHHGRPHLELHDRGRGARTARPGIGSGPGRRRQRSRSRHRHRLDGGRVGRFARRVFRHLDPARRRRFPGQPGRPAPVSTPGRWRTRRPTSGASTRSMPEAPRPAPPGASRLRPRRLRPCISTAWPAAHCRP
jgi:hypothetical protein